MHQAIANCLTSLDGPDNMSALLQIIGTPTKVLAYNHFVIQILNKIHDFSADAGSPCALGGRWNGEGIAC